MKLTLSDVVPFGPITSFLKEKNGIIFQTKQAVMEIATAPGESIRIRWQLGENQNNYHTSVLEIPSEKTDLPSLSLENQPDKIRVYAPEISIDVRLETATLSFQTKGRTSLAKDIQIGTGPTENGNQCLAIQKELVPGEVIYGLGEKTGWLDKRFRKYTMRTCDILLENSAGIGHSTDPMYASIPIFIVHGIEGSYGIFVDNPEFSQFDFRHEQKYEFSVPAQSLTYYLLPGPSLPDIMRQYTCLTGRMPLPALWTLGYHQCRWSYRTESEVRKIAHEFLTRHIPLESIWCDIDYMDEFRIFTWNAQAFPNFGTLAKDLGKNGIRMVTIVDPGVKVDSDYQIYQEGHVGRHFITKINGEEFHGKVWPGVTAFPDFHQSPTRDWWAKKIAQWMEISGASGIWIDMNEPACTDLDSPLMEARHENGLLPHTSARNTYALQMARATFQGMRAFYTQERPFILTRSAYSGTQTVAALWCGDNHSCWEHLAASIPMLLNLGLSGMPFVGVDIGGFVDHCHGELLARWTQAAAFFPFCRNHSAAQTRDQEPWEFGENIEKICKKYIELRYQLLPYLYTLFYQSSQAGSPVMRPLVWHYPNDIKTFNLNDEFLLGANILIAPVLSPGLCARAVYLPEGNWYKWGTSEEYEGGKHIVCSAPLEEIPIFVRAGAVLPMWKPAMNTSSINRSEMDIHIWPGNGSFTLYEDDGSTHPQETNHRYRLTNFDITKTGNQLAIRWQVSGEYAPSCKRILIFHNWNGNQALLDGIPIHLNIARSRDGASMLLPADEAEHQLDLTARPP